MHINYFRISIVKINQIPIIDITHNLCTKYGFFFDICKQLSKYIFNLLHPLNM